MTTDMLPLQLGQELWWLFPPFLYESNIVPLQVELGGEDKGQAHDEIESDLLRLFLCVI